MIEKYKLFKYVKFFSTINDYFNVNIIDISLITFYTYNSYSNKNYYI